MLSNELAQSARSRATRRTQTLDGTETVYYEYPPLSNSKQTLILVHGYRGNHKGLEAIAAGLSKYRVIIPDLPGFGESEALKQKHSVEAYSHWLNNFVEALGVAGNVHLVGHSFGTLVVGHYATKYPVASVSLVNPVSSPALNGPRAALTSLTKIYYLLAGFAPKFAGEWLLRNKMTVMVMSIVMAKTKDRSLRRWIHNQHLSNFSDFSSIRVAQEGYEASISANLAEYAGRIPCPVLVVAATLDDITDIQTQRRVVSSYPNGRIREIENVGHLVHYEAPDQAAKLISEFVEELP